MNNQTGSENMDRGRIADNNDKVNLLRKMVETLTFEQLKLNGTAFVEGEDYDCVEDLKGAILDNCWENRHNDEFVDSYLIDISLVREFPAFPPQQIFVVAGYTFTGQQANECLDEIAHSTEAYVENNGSVLSDLIRDKYFLDCGTTRSVDPTNLEINGRFVPPFIDVVSEYGPGISDELADALDSWIDYRCWVTMFKACIDTFECKEADAEIAEAIDLPEQMAAIAAKSITPPSNGLGDAYDEIRSCLLEDEDNKYYRDLKAKWIGLKQKCNDCGADVSWEDAQDQMGECGSCYNLGSETSWRLDDIGRE